MCKTLSESKIPNSSIADAAANSTIAKINKTLIKIVKKIDKIKCITIIQVLYGVDLTFSGAVNVHEKQKHCKQQCDYTI